MERGFLLDRTYGAVLGSIWAEGFAEMSWLGSLKNLRKKRRYSVVADRCLKCGFLESYAFEPTKATFRGL